MTSTIKSFFQRCRFFGIGGALILTIWLTTAIASGQQTQVDISAEANSTWCGTPHQLINCSTYPTGSHTWNGVGFQIPTPNNGRFSDTWRHYQL